MTARPRRRQSEFGATIQATPLKDSRRRAAFQASLARAKQRTKAEEDAMDQSGSDSDDCVSEPPSNKSARAVDDRIQGAAADVSSALGVMPQYLPLHILFIVLILTADDMTVLHVGTMAEVCGSQIWRLQGRLAETSHA